MISIRRGQKHNPRISANLKVDRQINFVSLEGLDGVQPAEHWSLVVS